MRKRIGFALIFILILSACSAEAYNTPEGLRIYQDDVYGCEYVNTGADYGGLTPRLTADGSQAGCTK